MYSSSEVVDYQQNTVVSRLFVEELVKNKQSADIVYHVACLSDDKHQTHFSYEGADCFTIKAPKIGPARVIAYDMMAIKYGLQMVKKERIEHPIFYILGNTIGAFIVPFAKKIHAVGGKVLSIPMVWNGNDLNGQNLFKLI